MANEIMTEGRFLSLHGTFRTEDQFQAAFNMYVSHNYESLRHFYFHIPNEQKGGIKDVMRDRALGVLPGVPDFYFLKPLKWWLELKLPDGKLSQKQKDLHLLWGLNGEKIYTVWNPLQAVSILKSVVGVPNFAQ